MKKVLVILFATGFLLACNTGTEHPGHNPSKRPPEKEHEHERKTGGLVLNHGVKWKADSTTLVNVALLQNIVRNAKKESPANHQQTAARLQDGLNKMVQECKMTGAEHDALHQWLEPLMEGTKALKKEMNLQKASTLFSEIEKQLTLFPQYFE